MPQDTIIALARIGFRIILRTALLAWAAANNAPNIAVILLTHPLIINFTESEHENNKAF